MYKTQQHKEKKEMFSGTLGFLKHIQEISFKQEKTDLRCINSGNQASWRDPNCNKYDKPLHQKNFKAKSEDCKCHDINEQIWIDKKSPD